MIGNTVIVVEHDEDIMRDADHIIDIGPAAGKQGGELVAQGSIEDIIACERSLDRPVSQRQKKYRFTPAEKKIHFFKMYRDKGSCS